MVPTIVRWESVAAGGAMARDEGESEERMMAEMGSNPQTEDATSTGALVPSVLEGSNRSDFLARIKAIIDNATEAVRAMKEENDALAMRIAALEDENGTLTSRVNLLTSSLSREELALQQSVEQLEQTLQAATAPTAEPDQQTAAPEAATETAPEMAAPTAPLADAGMPETEADEAGTAATEDTPAAPEMTGESEDGEEPVAVRAMTEAETEEQALPASQADATDTETAESETDAVTAPQRDAEPQPEAMPESETVPESDTAAEPAAPVITGGVYTLITYPFVRFSDLGQFQAALQRLRGVHDVQVRRFAQGTLEMTARYEGETDLATALRSLEAEIEEVSEEAPYRLRVRLRSHAEG